MAQVDTSILGRKTSTEFAEFLYKGSYENVVVVAVWNKLYSKDVFDNVRFCGRYNEDDAIHNTILSKSYDIFIMNQQFYVYAENPSSLTSQPFRDDNLLFLSILQERDRLFSHDMFIKKNTQLLYCSTYIEYFFKAKHAGILMPSVNVFDRYIRELIRSGSCSSKFALRMILFRICPKLYEILLNIREKLR